MQVGLPACGSSSAEEVGAASEPVSGDLAVIDNGSTRPHVAAVGQLQFPSLTEPGVFYACTGTLVSRNRVLTAGHCFDDFLPEQSGTFTIPNGAPIDGSPASLALNEVFPIDGWERLGGFGSHDIAMVTLALPVSATIVPTIPRVFTGGFPAAWNDGRLRKAPATTVGFGGTIPHKRLQDEDTDGNRRFGVMTGTLLPHEDPCDLLDSGACYDDYVFRMLRTTDPQPERGDSGGPLFLVADSGDPIIAGVWSGAQVDDEIFAPERVYSIWGPTGNPGGAKNGTFIAERLGGDGDSDGILDQNDNCPPAVCTNRGHDSSACANPDQADDDGDSIGDVCDNCRKSVCDLYGATPPPGITCVNVIQGDRDRDGIGDSCDLCPLRAGRPGSREWDADGDGVGDACDPCPGSTPYPTCTSDAGCGGGALCIRESPVSAGRCNKLPDSDGDGLPDACDSCPAVANAVQENTNSLAEIREAQPAAGDACDPVPLVRTGKQRYTALGDAPLTPGDGVGPDDVQNIDFDRWLGVNPATPAQVATGSRRITFRHCSCKAPGTGQLLDLARCVGSGLQCNWTSPLGNTAAWRRITLPGIFGINQIGSSGWMGSAAFRTGQAFTSTATWAWRADAVAGRIMPSSTTCSSGGTCETHGALFATVEASTSNPFSSRDQLSLRDTFEMRSTPGTFRGPDRFFPLPQDLSPVGWIVDGYRDPSPIDFARVLDRPTPILANQGSIAVWLRPDLPIDGTAYFDTALALRLRQGDMAWLTPVESARVLRTRYDFSRASVSLAGALLGRSMHAGMAPLYVTRTPTGFTALDPLDEVDPGAGSGSGGGPALQSGVKGALSLIDASIYMVGGTDADGAPARAIWRWDFLASRWDLALSETRYPPSSTVLATTIDSIRKALYVLDVDDSDALWTRWARLIRYDTVTGTSTQILRIPYAPLFQRFGMAVLEDGSLVLAAGASLTYSAWRIDASSTAARFLGIKVGLGKMIDGPVLGEDLPYVAVSRQGRMEVDALGAAAFLPGGECTSL